MKAILTITALIVFLIMPVPNFGQRKAGTRNVTDRSATTEPDDDVPLGSDFVFVVNIYGDKSASVRLQTSESSNVVDPKDIGCVFGYFSNGTCAKGKIRGKALDPVIVVNVLPSLKIGNIIDMVEPLRQYGKNRIKITTGPGEYLIVPARFRPKRQVKPNPLTLVVALQKEGGITLNNDPYGSITDTIALEKKLREIFQDRSLNGVFREMSKQLESTVYIRLLDEDIPFWQLLKLVAAARKAGSDRTILYVTEQNHSVETRKTLLN